MLLIQLILTSTLAILQVYRMWLNAQVYRFKYNYKKPAIYHAQNLREEEVYKAQEASLFILFCFFTLIWFKKTNGVRHYQTKSNLMFVLT